LAEEVGGRGKPGPRPLLEFPQENYIKANDLGLAGVGGFGRL
jgi:hypothetical protein